MAVTGASHQVPEVPEAMDVAYAHLTEAQILALHTTATVVEVIKAPGPGRIIDVCSVLARYNAGEVQYGGIAAGTDDIEIRQEFSGNAPPAGEQYLEIETTGFLDGGSDDADKIQRRLAETSAKILKAATGVVARLGGAVTKDDAPAWVVATDYTVGEFVTQTNVSYRCIRAHTALTGNVPDGAPDQAMATAWEAATPVAGTVDLKIYYRVIRL